ncbi:MAG: alpha/beta hydrolase [Provencibacterium sp.]|nr:alpha/beta hydrolase [Provencibacterium sp.]
MRTNIRTLTFKSSNGSDTVSGVVYYPEAAPVHAVVLLSHGMYDHIGRYRSFMLYLAHHGIAAFGHDHLGHGKTAPAPEKLGYFAPQNGYQYLVRDLRQLCGIAGGMFPEVPRFLIGHSMGSLIARLYCLKYPDSIRGAAFIGTPGPNPLTGLGSLLAQRAIRRSGPFSRPELLANLTTGSFNRRFVPSRTEKDWLTRDEAEVDRAVADPLCGFTFTASAFADLFAMMEIANSQKWAKGYPKNLPTLLLSGDSDPVTDFGRGALRVYERLLGNGVLDLHLQLYQGARHELLGEVNREEVYDDLLAWMEARMGKPASGPEPGEAAPEAAGQPENPGE